MKPLGHRVLLKACDLSQETESGIILHYGEDQKLRTRQQQLAKVVDLGPDAFLAFRKMDDNGKEVNGKAWCKVGDLVYTARMASTHYFDPYSGEEWIIINDEDIQAVVSEGEMPEVELPVFKLKT